MSRMSEVPIPKGHNCNATPIPKAQGTSWKEVMEGGQKKSKPKNKNTHC